ncbi:MAG: Rieske 2Fe-2S domain-containing protein [Anaerolineae bacterium]|nr:Rieske 2Fe-2S domain-containing protein [Anaerolineae bacterium]MDW8172640.1 Rieske 2Fe-2S domain-containing protein [Anaerolineae bacterium]
MATANPSQGELATRASIAKPSQEVASAAPAAPAVTVPAPTRREFLYYIWGASLALLLGQATAGLIWFIFPRFREGEFGGVFPFNPADLPEVGAQPTSVPSGRFHVSNTAEGVLALYGVCTHLGCLPKWVATNDRFECPCHGSKFTGDGSWIEGPAPRGLDRFNIELVYADGTRTQSDGSGSPIPIAADKTLVEIRVNTGKRSLGPGHGVRLGPQRT